MGKYQLSYGQQSLYFIQKMYPASTAYNVGLGFKYFGRFQDGCLREALAHLMHKYPILKTRFSSSDGEIVQYIRPEAQCDLSVTDVHGMDEQSVAGKVNQDFHRSFHLERDNLLRVNLYRHEDFDLVVFAVHHIIADFNSVEVIFHDFIAIYDAVACGRPVEESNEAAAYETYVREELAFVGSERFEAKMEHWKEVLKDLPEGLDFAVESQQSEVGALAGARVEFQVTGEEKEKIVGLCQEHHISPFIFFLTIYQMFLFQVYGKRDVVVGVPVNLRRAVKYKRAIGNFTNLLPVRMRAQRGSFMHAADQVNETFVEAMLHKKVPYALLVQHINPSREKKDPIFQTTFNYLASRIRDNEVNMDQSGTQRQLVLGYEIEAYPLDQQLDQMDLAMEIVEYSGGFTGMFKYNRSFFRQEQAEDYVARYKKILARVLDCTQVGVEELRYGDEQERHELIYRTGQRAKSFTAHSNVMEMIETVMDCRGQRTAAVDEEKTFTYQQLRDYVQTVACRLQQMGIGKGDPIVVYMDRRVEVLVAFLAILKVGAVYVPIDVSFPANRVQYILECTASKAILTQQELVGKQPFLEGALGVDALLVAPQADLPALKPVQVTPQDSAYIIFTSGSTGKPKGVEIQHAALINFLQSMAEVLELTGRERLSIGGVTSIAFDISILEFLLPLTLGGQAAILPKSAVTDAAAFDAWVEKCGVNVFQATATTCAMLRKLGWQGRPDMDVLVGGEMVPRELAHQLTETCANVWNVYGPTEATIWATAKKLSPADRAVTIGMPLHNMEAYILDEEFEVVQKNVIGKLYLAGVGLAKGYYRREELTRERFFHIQLDGVDKLIYDTGDLARYLQNGEIQVMGRADDQVKLSGYRIELGEIESVLDQFDGVSRSAVLIQNQKLVAYLVYNGQEEETLVQKLREHCKGELTAYMIPTEFIQVPYIPLTPNQKTDRKTLASMQGKRLGKPRESVVENRGAYGEMYRVWKAVLGDFEFGIDDNFFDIGGTSLLAMTLQQHINQQLHLDVQLPDIFTYTTVRALSDHLASQGQAQVRNIQGQQELRRGRNRLGNLRRQKMGSREKQ